MWVDVNGNGIYEPPNDYPVMKGAQNLFCSFTDGYPDTTSNVMRTRPMRAEVHLYVWAKENPDCADAIYYEWKIINKNISPWNFMSAAVWSDGEIGPVSDKAGTDSSLNLVFDYSGTNNNSNYGIAPPSVGYAVKFATGHTGQQADFGQRWRCAFDCPTDAGQVFNVMNGYKYNGESWRNPVTNNLTKFPYSGDPVSGTGWLDDPMGERYVIVGSMFGNVAPLDTIDFQSVTLIKRGSNNLTSINEVKNCVNSVVGINQISNSVPDAFELYQNFPNPFNPKTTISYKLQTSSEVTLQVFDNLGREVSVLVNQKQNSGSYSVQFDGSNLSSGIYFYRIQAGNFREVKSMIMLK